jgi:phosphate uptake regulator
MVEFRRLIGFGKSSFVVSLPKNWIEKNKLVKGDLV